MFRTILPDFIHRFRRRSFGAGAIPQCGLLLATCGVLLLAGKDSVFGQATSKSSGPAYPNKPLRFLLGFAPGASDNVARIASARLSGALGQPVVIDNRHSTSGSTTASIIARAPSGGMTASGIRTLEAMIQGAGLVNEIYARSRQPAQRRGTSICCRRTDS